MADATLKVAVTYQQSGVTNSLGNINTSSKSAANSTDILSKALDKVKSKLASIAKINPTTLTAGVSALTSLSNSKGISNLSKNINKSFDFSKAEVNIANLKSKLDGLKSARAFYANDKTFSSSMNSVFVADYDNKIKKQELLIQEAETEMKALAEGTKEADTAAKGLNATLKSTKLLVAGIVAAIIAAIAIIKKLTSNAIAIAAEADDINDQANKFFMNTDQYQKWNYILSQSGVEMSSLKTAMRSFVKVATTDDVAKEFEATVKQIENIESTTKKAAVAMEKFGNRATELMPIFNYTNDQLDELIEKYYYLGMGKSSNLIKLGDKLSDDITDLKGAWTGLKNTLAETFIPVLIPLVESLTDLIVKINDMLRRVNGLTILLSDVLDSDNNFTDSVETLKRTLAGFDELNILSFNASSDSDYDYSKKSSSDYEPKTFWQALWEGSSLGMTVKYWKVFWEAFRQGAFDYVLVDIAKVLSPIKSFKDNIALKFSEFIRDIIATWDAGITLFKISLKSIGEWFANIGTTIKDGLKGAITAVGNWGKDLANSIGDIWTKIKSKFTDGLKSIGNFFVEAFNSLITKLNSSTIGKALKLNIGKISKFAKGGVLTTPTLGLMGEYSNARSNPEIVTPQSIMAETFDASNDRVVNALAKGISDIILAIENNGVTISGDAKQIFKVVQNQAHTYTAQTGKLAF